MNGDAPSPAAAPAHKPLPPPLAFASWLGANASLLQPPVNNYCLFSGADFVLMVVGGPNARNDYHVNETEEWFYQLKGAMLLKVVERDPESGREFFKDVRIEEGEMFLLPGNTPHNPCRFADTVGLVMERVRPEGSLDRLRWYCKKGGHEAPTVIREEVFHCTDLGSQLKPLINNWRENESVRKCPVCGETEDAQ